MKSDEIREKIFELESELEENEMNETIREEFIRVLIKKTKEGIY